MSNPVDSHEQQRVELAIQREIRISEDQLVQWIQARLDDFDTYGKLEESQYRNVMHVADSTESPEAVKNFLLYQLGRDKKWGKGPDALAKKIIADIGEEESGGRLYKLACTIAERTTSSDTKGIWMSLIRRYLGFGSRYLVYLNKTGANRP